MLHIFNANSKYLELLENLCGITRRLPGQQKHIPIAINVSHRTNFLEIREIITQADQLSLVQLNRLLKNVRSLDQFQQVVTLMRHKGLKANDITNKALGECIESCDSFEEAAQILTWVSAPHSGCRDLALGMGIVAVTSLLKKARSRIQVQQVVTLMQGADLKADTTANKALGGQQWELHPRLPASVGSWRIHG